MQRRLDGWRVHNLGLIGAGTVQEYLLFQKHVAERLRPGDAVVLVFFGNDFGDNVGLHLAAGSYATIDRGEVRLVPPAPASAVAAMQELAEGLFVSVQPGDLPVSHRFQDKRRDAGAWRPDRGPYLRRTDRRPIPRQQPAGSNHAALPVGIAGGLPAKQARFLVAYVPGQAELDEDDVTSTSDLSLPEEIAARWAFERMVRDLGIETVDLMARRWLPPSGAAICSA